MNAARIMKQMTIRNVPEATGAALDRERRRRGLSLSRTVVALIEESLGLGGHPRSNGLRGLAGSWDDKDFERFEVAVAPFGEVDEGLWK